MNCALFPLLIPTFDMTHSTGEKFDKAASLIPFSDINYSLVKRCVSDLCMILCSEVMM